MHLQFKALSLCSLPSHAITIFLLWQVLPSSQWKGFSGSAMMNTTVDMPCNRSLKCLQMKSNNGTWPPHARKHETGSVREGTVTLLATGDCCTWPPREISESIPTDYWLLNLGSSRFFHTVFFPAEKMNSLLNECYCYFWLTLSPSCEEQQDKIWGHIAAWVIIYYEKWKHEWKIKIAHFHVIVLY